MRQNNECMFMPLVLSGPAVYKLSATAGRFLSTARDRGKPV